jgi:hypothetical protein
MRGYPPSGDVDGTVCGGEPSAALILELLEQGNTGFQELHF